MLQYKLVPVHSLASKVIQNIINFEEITYIERDKTYFDVDTRIFRNLFKHYLNKYVSDNQHENIIVVNTCEVLKNWVYQSVNNKYPIHSNIPLYLHDNDMVFNRYVFWNFLQKNVKKISDQIKVISHSSLSSKDIIKYLANVHIGENFVHIDVDKTCIFCDLNYSFLDIQIPRYLIQQLELSCKKINL